jgi:hypothetical protein
MGFTPSALLLTVARDPFLRTELKPRSNRGQQCKTRRLPLSHPPPVAGLAFRDAPRRNPTTTGNAAIPKSLHDHLRQMPRLFDGQNRTRRNAGRQRSQLIIEKIHAQNSGAEKNLHNALDSRFSGIRNISEKSWETTS